MKTEAQEMRRFVVCIDNGHGKNTPGKCSPDKTIWVWEWNREVAKIVCEMLQRKNIDARLIVKEDYDVSLTERCRRVNAIYEAVGKKNCICLSVHINAARGDGNWSNARGYSVFVSEKNASERSKRLAKCIEDVALERGHKGNRSVPSCHYWQKDLKILRSTNCPAVLCENLFMDNKLDCAYLLTQEGKEEMATVMCQGILNYIG